MSSIGFNSFGPAEVKTALVNSSASSISIASAEAGKRIVIVSMSLSSSTAGEVSINSGSTTIGVTRLGANAPVVWPWTPDGWLVSNTGEALSLSNSGGLALRGWVRYAVV